MHSQQITIRPCLTRVNNHEVAYSSFNHTDFHMPALLSTQCNTLSFQQLELHGWLLCFHYTLTYNHLQQFFLGQLTNLGPGCPSDKVSKPQTAHTHTRTHGRTPLNEWSARRIRRYLHNAQQRDESSMPSVRFEPAILAIERLQSYYALDRTTIWIGFQVLRISNTSENGYIQITKLLCFRKPQLDWTSEGPKNIC